MDFNNLVDNLPDILRGASSSYGYSALALVVVSVLCFVLYARSSEKDRNRAFILTILFFAGLTIFTQTGSIIAAFQRGNEVGIEQGSEKVQEQIQQDPSVVNISSDAAQTLDELITSDGLQVDSESKTLIVEKAIRVLSDSLEAESKPEPIVPGYPSFDTQCAIPISPVVSDKEDPRRVIYKRLPKPTYGESYLDICLRVEFTDEILEQAGGYENARQMILSEGAKLETSYSQSTSHLPLSPTNNYTPGFVSTLAGDSTKAAVQTIRSGDKHSVNLIVNSTKYAGELTVVDASTSQGFTELKILINFED